MKAPAAAKGPERMPQANDSARAAMAERAAAIRAHNSAVAAASLEAVELREARFTRSRSERKQAAAVPARIRVKHEARDTSFDAAVGRCVTTVLWSVSAEASSHRAGLRAQGSYLVAYDGLAGMDQAVVVPLIEHLARFASFPYFRAYVAQMASAAGILMPPLQVLKGQIRTPVPARPAQAD